MFIMVIVFIQTGLIVLLGYLWLNEKKKSQQVEKIFSAKDLNLEKCAQRFPVLQSTINSIHTEVDEIYSQIFRQFNLITENNRILRSNGESAAHSAEEVSNATQAFGGQLHSMSAATEELSVTIRSVAENCQLAAHETSDANKNVKHLRESFLELSGLVNDVGSFVSVIQEIAAQTNLLALNATIEAASAGEAGKGFAVVASEVKDLARQSASSASKIEDQINRILAKVNETNDKSKVLLNAIDQLEKITLQIASTSTQQAEASHQLTENLSQFSHAGSEIATQVQTISRAIQEIALMSGNTLDICQKSSHILEERARSGLESIKDSSGYVQEIVSSHKQKEVFDIVAIKKGHMEWYKKVQGLIQGTIDLKPEEVTSHKTCGLGKWYFGEGSQTLSTNPLFKELGSIHEAVHTAAHGVAKAVSQQDMGLAKNQVTIFETNRKKLFGILDKLYVKP